MSSVYPGAIDGYSQIRVARDGIDSIVANDHNSERNSIIAIEQTLGLNPQGSYGTVSARLDSSNTSIESHVQGGLPRHQDIVIDSIARSGTYHSLTLGTVGSQITELLADINYILYPGSAPSTFADGYALPSSNIRGAVTTVVEKVGNTGGAGRIGATAFIDGQYNVSGVTAQAQIANLGQFVNEAGTFRRRVFDTFVSEGFDTVQGTGVNASVNPGVLLSNGRIASTTSSSTVTISVTPGTYFIYAKAVDGTITFGASDEATATASVTETTVLLYKIVHNGTTWTSSLDIRRYGMLDNDKHSFVVANPSLITDGYGYDFTTIKGAVEHLLALKVGAQKAAPIEIILATDLTLATTTIIDNSTGATGSLTIDGGGHIITLTDDIPAFTVDGSYINLHRINIESNDTTLTDMCFVALGSVSSASYINIQDCQFKSTGAGDIPPYFIRCGDSGGTESVTYLLVDNCVANYTEAAIDLQTAAAVSAAKLNFGVISNNVFLQDTSNGVLGATCIRVESNCKVVNNYILHNGSGVGSSGILAQNATNTIISENKIDGNDGATASLAVGIGMLTVASATTNCLTIENIVEGITSIGISSTGANNLISKNIVSNESSLSTNLTGISCTVSNMIEGNFVSSALIGINGKLVIGNYIYGGAAGAPTSTSGINMVAEGIALNNIVQEIDGAGIDGYTDCFASGNYLLADGALATSAFYNFESRSQIVGNFVNGYGVAGTSGSGVRLSAGVQSAVSIVGNYFYECIDDVIQMLTSDDCLIALNYAFGTANTVNVVDGTGNRTLILGNTIVGIPNVASYIILLTGDGNSVINNAILNCAGYGINLQQKTDCICSGNILYGAGGNLNAILGVGDRTSITNNYIYDYCSSFDDAVIECSAGSNDVVVVGNMIESCGGIGIDINGGSRALVSSNHLNGDAVNSTSGIVDMNEESIISNNIITNYGIYTGSHSAIKTDTSAGKSLIIGNIIHECGANLDTGIYLSVDVYYLVIGNIIGDAFSSPAKVGIDINDGAYNTILDNIIGGAKSGTTDDNAIDNVGDYNLISNNYITKANYHGISIIGANVSCTGNYVFDPYEDGINVDGYLTDFQICNNYIYGPDNDGISIDDNNSSGIINDNFIDTPGANGIELLSNVSYGSNNIMIHDNAINNAVTDGIKLSYSNYNSVSGNYIISSGDDGIELVSCLRTIVDGNFIYSCDYGLYTHTGSNYSSITNNYVNGTVTGSDIIVNASTNCLVNGNYSNNSNSSGITLVSTCDNTNVVGNFVYGSGADGIYSSSGYVSITGNMISSPTSEGIYCSDGYSSITNNSIHSSGADGILIAGNNFIVSGNSIWTSSENGIDASAAGAGLNSVINGNHIGNITDGIKWNSTGHRATISNNFISNISGVGISLGGADDCVLSSNIITSFSTTAIDMPGSKECIVIGNKSFDAAEDGYGLDFSGSVNMLVVGNMMESNGNDGYAFFTDDGGIVGAPTYLMIANLADGYTSPSFTSSPVGTQNINNWEI